MVKAACLILTLLIMVAVMAVCVMVKFASEITVQEKKREYMTSGDVINFASSVGVISMSDNTSAFMSERFPYVAAIARNSSNKWAFNCFASVILTRWVVTSAHCRRQGHTHRVLIYQDFARNYSHTYPILFWRIHDKFNSSMSSKYDIAVAKLNVDSYPFSTKSSVFDDKVVTEVETSVWKTVSTMDKKIYLTNDFDKFEVNVAPYSKCIETYEIMLDESFICLDYSEYEDCFIHEFGPIYYGDKVVGILALKPKDCDVKLVIFTNVSYYSDWIMRSTSAVYYG